MRILFAFLTLVFGILAVGSKPREIVIQTEKVGEAVHWKPEAIEVAPGENVKFVVKHELEGGFDFHGLFIPELKISKEIHRNKPVNIVKTIPKSLKPGEYQVGCHFHPKHVPAKLVVKAADTAGDSAKP